MAQGASAAPASNCASVGAAASCAYVVNEAAGTVSVIDPTSRTVIANPTVGSLPQAVAISPDGTAAYVTNWGSGTLSVIDTTAGSTTVNQVTDTITVGQQSESEPDGVAIAPDGSAVYITYGYRAGTDIGPGMVAVMPTSGEQADQIKSRIPVGDEPAGIALTPDGATAFVADYGSGQISEINTADATVIKTIDVGGTPQGVAVTPDGKTVYVTNGNSNSVSIINAATGAVTTRTDPSLQAPQGVATGPNGDGAFVADFDCPPSNPGCTSGHVTAIGAGGTVTGTVGVGTNPFGVAYSPDGKTVYASNSSAGGSVSVIDATKRTLIGGPINVADNPLGLAFVPDQAPRVALDVTARSAGNATVFDASASTVRYGTMSYTWRFGDGFACHTCAAITTHTYAEPGVYTVSVTATDSAGTSTRQVFTGQTVSRNGGPSATAQRSVTIVASRPVATLSPTALDFGTQTISQLYLSKPVTLTNTGDAPLEVASTAITGTDRGQFAVADDHCSGTTVAPGSQCIMEVRFVPTTVGASAATLQITSDAAGSPQSVALTGVAASPLITISPAGLTFPNQAPGSVSAPQKLTLTNTGDDPLTVSNVAMSGKDPAQFGVTAGTCIGNPVPAGASCSIYIDSRPTAFGAHNALVEITDDAPGSPHVASVAGLALGSQAALSPAQLSFADQRTGTTSRPRTVHVTNTGNAPLHITRTALDGRGAKAFRLTGDTCAGNTVAPGNSCALRVVFRPSARVRYSARVSLGDDSVAPTSGVRLTGRGVAPVARLAPPALIFGSVNVGSHGSGHTVTVTNAGTAPLRIQRAVLVGRDARSFSIATDRCHARTLAPARRCQIVLGFAPRRVGALHARLGLHDNAAGGTQSVGLRGVGRGAVLSVRPGRITFAGRRVGTESAPRQVQVHNSGNAAIRPVLRVVGHNSRDFVLHGHCASLQPGRTCTVTVTFSPRAKGARAARLRVTDARGAPSVTLTGRGRARHGSTATAVS